MHRIRQGIWQFPRLVLQADSFGVRWNLSTVITVRLTRTVIRREAAGQIDVMCCKLRDA
jgi:hypothetical protein